MSSFMRLVPYFLLAILIFRGRNVVHVKMEVVLPLSVLPYFFDVDECCSKGKHEVVQKETKPT